MKAAGGEVLGVRSRIQVRFEIKMLPVGYTVLEFERDVDESYKFGSQGPTDGG